MLANKLAIVGATVAAVSVGFAITSGAADDSSRHNAVDHIDVDIEAGVLLDASTGIAPVADVTDFFRQRVERRPDDHVSRTQLAESLSAEARQTADHVLYAEAETMARAALELVPDHEPAKLALATALQSQHRFVEARQIGRDLLAENPASIDALYVVSDADYELGHYDEAELAYRRLEDAGRNAAVVTRLARIASAKGADDAAVALSEEALALSGAFSLRPHGKAYYPFQVGHFRFKVGDIEGAIESLHTALAIAPEHRGVIEELATVFAATGDVESVRSLHAQLAPELRDDLVRFLTPRDPALALDLARTDADERPGPVTSDALAWALHLNGRIDDAATASATALEQGLDTATGHYHAGAIAASLGVDDDAIEHLDAALAAGPDFAFADADAARALLTELRGGAPATTPSGTDRTGSPRTARSG